MKKRFALSLIFLFFCVSVFVSGCGEVKIGTKITSTVDEVTIRLDDSEGEGGDLSTANFEVTVNEFKNSHIVFRVENEGVVLVSSERKYDRYSVTVTGLKAGQAKVVAFLTENSKVHKDILVNVIQPIKSMALVTGYTHYVAIGHKNAIRPNESMMIAPIDGNVSEIKYSIESNPQNLNVTIDENTGVIDATNATSAGSLVVKAKVSDEVFANIPVNVIKGVDKEDVTIRRVYSTDNDSLILYQNGQAIYDTLTMVKTIEYYSEFVFEIDYTANIMNQNLTISKNGESVTAEKLSVNKVAVKAVGLGKSAITLKFSIDGAEDFIEPLEITFNVSVIESPYDINVNGESSKANGGEFNKTIYNRYASGDYGMAFRFTLTPSSVLEENADILIEFEDTLAVQNSLLILDSEGNRLGAILDASGSVVGFEPFTVKAGETIYIKSTLSTVAQNTKYSFTATSQIAKVYNKGDEVKAKVNLTVLEGIQELTTGQSTIYVEKGEGSGSGSVIYLGTGNNAGDTSGITYKIDNDNIRILKQSNTEYVVYGLKAGESEITFDSGNGHYLTIKIIVYGKLESAIILGDNQFENGSIGEKVVDGQGSLSYVSAKIKGGFSTSVKVNDDASVALIRYEVNAQGQQYVSVSNNTGYVSILGVGRAVVTVYIYGYNEFGVVQDDEALTKTFSVEGYIPINNVAINYASATLKDYTTVGYNNISKHSQLKLNLSIYPNNASIKEEDIAWEIVGSSGSISEFNGLMTTFTAGPILDSDRDSEVVTVVAYVKDKGRTYSANCVIEVVKAVMVQDIKFVNVFNSEIYFDARDGLASYDNENNLVGTRNSYNVQAVAYPNDAFNKNLKYIYIQNRNDDNAVPVFTVSSDGRVMPLRGGVATLRVVAEDSYVDLDHMSLYRDIQIVVADGSSIDTAYRITDSNDLIAIGENTNSMSLHYVLANDIDLSKISSWTPIGAYDRPFTGYLSGKYKIGYNQIEITSKITGLSIDANVSGSNNAYVGLFASINCGQIVDLEVECSKFNINASNLNADLYVGILAGVVRQTIDDTIDRNEKVKKTKIENISVKSLVDNVDNYCINLAQKSNFVGGAFGFIENGVNVTLGGGFTAVDLKHLKVVDNGAITDNDIYVGGFAGAIQSNVYINSANEITSILSATVTGSLSGNATSGDNGKIIYQSYFGNGGLDVVLGELIVEDAGYASSAVGGFIGSAIVDYSTATTAEGEDDSSIDFKAKSAEDFFNKIMIKDVGVSANIVANSILNVGGIVGANDYYINNAYFTGKIKGKSNVGGISGVSTNQISDSVVETGNELAIVGEDKVGGLVGFMDSQERGLIAYENESKTSVINIEIKSIISFSYISTAFKGNAISGSGSIGTIAGFVTNGFVLGCYSDIVATSGKMIGVANGADVRFSFANGATLGVINAVSSYYYISEADNSYNESNLINATYNDVKLWVKPGTTIVVNGKNVDLDESLNGGRLIICRPNELPLFSVLYDMMSVTVKEGGDKFVKVDDSKAVLFYYELDASFESNLSSDKKYEFRQIAGNLNVVNLSDVLDVEVFPIPFSAVRLNVVAKDAKGNESKIVSVNANGTITIKGEGLVLLEISSVVNPSLKTTIQIYVTNFVSAFKLYSGTNASGVEYDNGATISIRKDFKLDAFAKILSTLNDVEFKQSERMGLTIEMQSKASNTYIEGTTSYYTAIGGKVYKAEVVGSDVVFKDLTGGTVVFEAGEDGTINLFMSYNGGKYPIYQNMYTSYFDFGQFTVNQQEFSATYYIEIDDVKHYATMSNNNLVFNDLDVDKLILDKVSKDGKVGYGVYYNGRCYPVYVDKITMDVDSVGTLSFEGIKSYSNEIIFKPFIKAQFVDELNVVVTQNVYASNKQINAKNANINIYEGAINIEASVDSVVYSPSDTISFEVFMISDSKNDGLTAFVSCGDDYLNLSLNYQSTTMLEDGTYKIIYLLNANLENSFTARYLTENKSYDVTFVSDLIADKTKNITLTFAPQQVQRLDVLNYTSGEIKQNSDGEFVYNRNEVASLDIASNSMGMLSINMFPFYSNVDMVTVESEEVNGEKITFTQLVANKYGDGTGGYSAIKPRSQYTDDGKAMILQKYSNVYDEEKSFDGNFYVRTLISDNLPEGTILPVKVTAYTYDENGVLQVSAVKTIDLNVKEIPFVKVELEEESTTHYVVRGTTTNLKVTMGRTFAGQTYNPTAVLDNEELMLSESEVEKVIYTQSNNYDIVNGREVYKDTIYVGIGIPSGTKITVLVVVDYEENGISKSVYSELELIVIDYLIDDIDLYSFNNESNYLRMNMQEYYEIGVSKIFFKSAPTFEVARRMYSSLSTESEGIYNGYFYGTIKLASGKKLYLAKSYNEFVFMNASGTNFEGKRFVYDDDYNLVLKSDSSITLNSLLPATATFELGLEAKMGKLENSIRYDISKFSKKISNNVYGSVETEITPNSKFYIKEDVSTGKAYLIGLSTGSNFGLKYTLKYGFDEYDNYNIKVYSDYDLPETFMIFEQEYSFNIVTFSDMDLPLPVYTQADFEGMTAGEHYILMNDITLTAYKPISTAISSFDGNGYSLIIKTFDIEAVASGNSIELGLFGTISEGTIIKNVTVNISELNSIDLSAYSSINIGFFALYNNGIVTNCAVSYESLSSGEVSYDRSTVINGVEIETVSTMKTLEIKTTANIGGTDTDLTMGAFVLDNNGDITNSRVGEDNNAFIQLKVKGSVAGFAYTNSGHIASSFVSNLFVYNTNPSATDSKTAGFVVRNQGEIMFSYVKGGFILENYRSKYGALISNGNIGGFVYENNGDISDSYSNITLSSNARTGGFVFSNESSGTIKTSYSASKVLTNSALHMPFIGVDAKSNVQNQNPNGIENCYYLKLGDEAYETSSLGEGVVALTSEEFAVELKFNNFSFSVTDVYDSVWTMEQGYPELVSANDIAKSTRAMVRYDDGTFTYIFGVNAHLGAKTNPYLIANAEDFNFYFNQDYKETDKVIDNKYYRIISNIDFNDVAGDNMTKDVTLCNVSIDGNGYKLSNIRINSSANDSETLSIGLFKKIYADSANGKFTTIKNLSLHILEANALNVSYMGGLAGIVEDTNILNINVSSDSVMQAYNVVGGLAGIISGQSVLNRINSSASVQAVYKASEKQEKPLVYDKQENVRKISHAGSVAGIADLSTELPYEEFVLMNNANIKFVSVSGDVSVSGEYVGGVFGYLGESSAVYDISFEVKYDDSENRQQIYSTYCAGGIVGVNYGSINHAKVRHSDENQAKVDNAIKTYLKTGATGNFGKTNLFNGKLWYVGGVVGINYGGIVTNSYTRVDIVDPNISSDLDEVTEQYFGGLVGVTYGGEISSAYASGNIVTKASETEENDNYYAGGLIGRVNYLAGRVIKDQDNKTNPYVITLRTLYALNYWDYSTAKTTFRTDGTNYYAGTYVGYVSPIEDSKITTDVGALYSINQIKFNGKNLFSGSNGVSGSVALRMVGKNDANLLGNSSELDYELERSLSSITLNDIYEIDSTNFAHVTTFLLELLNVSGGSIWDRYWGEYPELRLGNKLNEEEIYTAEQLIKAINESPYKTFRIMNDLDFSGVTSFVKRTFTGKLLSARTDDKDNLISTNFYNIDYTALFAPANKNENIGFFVSTKRATISEINFFIIGANYSSTYVERFGVVSAQDEASSLNNVRVICVSNPQVTSSNAKALSLGTLKINGCKVGGIVGDVSGTIVLNSCSFSGNIELINNYTPTHNLYFGGLIGYSAIVKLYDRTTFGYFDFATNMQFGVYTQKTATEEYAFRLVSEVSLTSLPSGSSTVKVSETDSKCDNLYVGGLVGFNGSMLIANNASIQGRTNSNITISVDASAKYIRVGGLAGRIDSGNIRNFYAYVNVNCSSGEWAYVGGLLGESTNAVISSVYLGAFNNNSKVNVENINSIAKVGGIVGSSIVTSMNASNLSNQTNAYVDIDFSGNAKYLAMGGIYGEFHNYAKTNQAIQNNRINAYGTLNANTAQFMYVGGLVGNNVLKVLDSNDSSATSINYSYSGMEISIYSNKIAYVGGIIGNAENLSLNNLVLSGDETSYKDSGSLEIKNCVASGYIDISTGSKFEHIYAGGIAGDTRDSISNTTILTTIVKPEYGNENKNKYNIDVLAGVNNYKGGNNGITVVDEVTGSRFESSKLLTSDDNTIRFANSDSYNILDYVDFLDEFDRSADMMYQYIKEFITIKSGTVFNPIRVSSSSGILSSSKTYHLLTRDITVTSSKSINGVFAGNYKQITVSDSLFSKIGKYGVVGNFAVKTTSSSGISSAMVADTSNGVIHDLYATGKVQGSSVGGVVTTNNGMILNVIADIEVISSGTSGIIASTSEDGTIFNCFTLGGLVVDSGNYAGTFVGRSENTLFKFVNSVTSLDTTLSSRNAGVVGYADSKTKFVYCSFDPQAVTRNSIATSTSSLKTLAFDRYLSDTINTGSSYYLLYATNKNTNNVCRNSTKNFGYAYFPRFDSFIRTTITGGYTYVNNFSAFYKLMDTDYKAGVKIKLAYNINQHGFDVKGETKKAWNPKSVAGFSGTLDGNNKKLKGIAIDSKKVSNGDNSALMMGFLYVIDNATITNLDLQLESAGSNMMTEYERYYSSSSASTNVMFADMSKYLSYSGGLCAIASKSTISKVKVSFLTTTKLTANVVGGLVGYAESTNITSCETSNLSVTAYDMIAKATSSGDAIYARNLGLAGGICGAMSDGNLTSSKNNGCTVTGDSALDANFYETVLMNNSVDKVSASNVQATVSFKTFTLQKNETIKILTNFDYTDGNNGFNASPVGGLVAYANNVNISSCSNSGKVVTGHAGNGDNAKGFDPETKKGMKGGNGGNVIAGGIVGINANCNLSGNTNSGSFDFVSDGDHGTAAGRGGNGSDGKDDATSCCYGRTNHIQCPLSHGDWGKGVHSCSDVTKGNDGGNGGNGGYAFIGNSYGATSLNPSSSSYKASGSTIDLQCAPGGDGGKGTKGGDGSHFKAEFFGVLLWEGYHAGKNSGRSGNGGYNGNKVNGDDGTVGEYDVDVGGEEQSGGAGAQSEPSYLQN